MNTQPWLLIIIEYLCINTILLSFIPRSYREYITILAMLTSFIYLLLILNILYNFDKSCLEFQYVYNLVLIPEYNFCLSLGIDGISLCFLLLTAFIMLLCIFAADTVNYKYKQFIIYLLLIEIFLSLSFIVTNLFFFYVFFESVLIPMFILIGIWGARERKINAAYYFFLYTLFGSFFLLFGILYLYTITGSTEYSIILNTVFSQKEQILLWLCFFVPFAVKLPMFPFHIWLPEAHVEAPTIGSVILASLLLKLGSYGLLRFTIAMFPLGCSFFSELVNVLSIVSIIYASLATMRQNDLKRIVAYSSIAHMNLIVLGLFSLTQQGVEGAIYLMIGHGIVSGGLFFCVGVLYDRYHTRLLKQYSGLVQVMPLFSICFFIFSLANMGFPGTCNFTGEFLILTGIFMSNNFVMILAAISVVLSACYSTWTFNRLAFGTLKTEMEITLNYADLTRAECVILVTLLYMLFILGLNSFFITSLISLPVKTILLGNFFKL